MEVFVYSGHTVSIETDVRKKKEVYWIKVDQRTLTFVSRMDTAKRIAIKFIDLITDSSYMNSRKLN